MHPQHYAITSSRIVLPDQEFSGHLLIEGSKIKDILPKGQLAPDTHNLDVQDLVVMPGVIDTHVHINEPGRSYWEGFETATQAAAAGGTTTLVDMPLNSSPVTTNLAALEKKLQAAEGKLYVNCGFWGGFVPGSQLGLKEILDSGVLGIKVFMTDSGLDEFQAVNSKELAEALTIMRDSNIPLLAHAEIAGPLPYANPLEINPTSYQAHLRSRPDEWELNAIDTLIELCGQFGTPVHVVHLATAKAIGKLKEAKRQIPITVETCPHYLFFSSEEIPDRRPEFKCAPPIRGWENNLQLWQALEDGVIDFVATDHSPAPPEAKFLDSGNLKQAWGGIGSLQFLLPVVWTCCQQHGQSIHFLQKVLCENPAAFIGAQRRKGKLAPGYDADFIVWDPEAIFTVSQGSIRYKHKISPYIGRQLKGMVHKTYVNGQLVFDDGAIDPVPRGTVVKK